VAEDGEIEGSAHDWNSGRITSAVTMAQAGFQRFSGFRPAPE
jgi:hypothetical protein